MPSEMEKALSLEAYLGVESTVEQYRALRIIWPYLEKTFFHAKLFSNLDFSFYIRSINSNFANFLRYSRILHNLICFTN